MPEGSKKLPSTIREHPQRSSDAVVETTGELSASVSAFLPWREPAVQPEGTEKRLERAKALVHEGNLGKACAALLSNGVVEVNEAALAELQAKHPPRPEPLLSTSTNLPPAIQVTTEEVSSVIGHQFVPTRKWSNYYEQIVTNN